MLALLRVSQGPFISCEVNVPCDLIILKPGLFFENKLYILGFAVKSILAIIISFFSEVRIMISSFGPNLLGWGKNSLAFYTHV